MAARFYAARYGDQSLVLTSYSGEVGRDYAVQSPSRGDDHRTQDRGRKINRVEAEILFIHQAGLAPYLDRWLAFRTLAESPAPSLFVHPIEGSYLAHVHDLRFRVDESPHIVATCTFVPPGVFAPVAAVGAGVAPQAGPEHVEVLVDRCDTQLAARGLTSSAPAAALEAAVRWAEADEPDARAIAVELASLTTQIDQAIADLDLVTDLSRWELYRSMVELRYTLSRAAASVASETEEVSRYTLAAAEPLRVLCARLFGAAAAVDRARQVQRLNGLRSPGLIPAGTTLVVPVVRT